MSDLCMNHIKIEIEKDSGYYQNYRFKEAANDLLEKVLDDKLINISHEIKDHSIEFSIETKYIEPMKAIMDISSKYPELTFNNEFNEFVNDYHGIFSIKNGKIISGKIIQMELVESEGESVDLYDLLATTTYQKYTNNYNYSLLYESWEPKEGYFNPHNEFHQDDSIEEIIVFLLSKRISTNFYLHKPESNIWFKGRVEQIINNGG